MRSYIEEYEYLDYIAFINTAGLEGSDENDCMRDGSRAIIAMMDLEIAHCNDWYLRTGRYHKMDQAKKNLEMLSIRYRLKMWLNQIKK